jgi:hypothetical protein
LGGDLRGRAIGGGGGCLSRSGCTLMGGLATCTGGRDMEPRLTFPLAFWLHDRRRLGVLLVRLLWYCPSGNGGGSVGGGG